MISTLQDTLRHSTVGCPGLYHLLLTSSAILPPPTFFLACCPVVRSENQLERRWSWKSTQVVSTKQTPWTRNARLPIVWLGSHGAPSSFILLVSDSTLLIMIEEQLPHRYGYSSWQMLKGIRGNSRNPSCSKAYDMQCYWYSNMLSVVQCCFITNKN